MTDLEKTLSCVQVFAAVALHDRSKAEIAALIKGTLGQGWSVVAAAQYLTGKAALEAFLSLPRDFTSEGLSRPEIGALIAAAHEFCATAHPQGAISNGVNVGNFAVDSEVPLEDRLKLLFARKHERH